MPYELIYNDLPEDIEQWQGLPLSLSDDEIMPLDYQAGQTGWLIYGKHLKKRHLSEFQSALGQLIVVVLAWKVKSYQVVRLAGVMPKKAKKIANDMMLDTASMGVYPTLKQPGLLVMDMDSTAITIECIDELGRSFGVGDKISAITEQAMQGNFDFVTSLRKRVMLLKGMDVSVLESLKQTIPMTSGLTYLVNQLKRKNWHVAIVSGGFTFYADALKEKLKINYAIANTLEIKNNKLTGRLTGDIIDGNAKVTHMNKLMSELNIPASQTVAVGDGANDLPMIKAASLGIAFHAKPKVRFKADAVIQHADLLGVLCILSATLSHKRR